MKSISAVLFALWLSVAVVAQQPLRRHQAAAPTSKRRRPLRQARRPRVKSIAPRPTTTTRWPTCTKSRWRATGAAIWRHKAIEEYRLAIEADPIFGIPDFGLAEFYAKTGRIRDAVVEAQDILKRDPNNLEAHKSAGAHLSALAGRYADPAARFGKCAEAGH